MPKKKKRGVPVKKESAFENTKQASTDWLSKESPLVCDAVRMQPEADPWEKKGKIVRQEHSTETKRKKLSELSLNVDHFISDESGAALA
jgi:hypothetical protein